MGVVDDSSSKESYKSESKNFFSHIVGFIIMNNTKNPKI